MENLKITVNLDGIEWVEIDRGNGEFTSMPKSIYDEQQAQLTTTPNGVVTNGDN